MDNESASQLLRPLDNYNNFAIKYGSIPTAGNLLYWEKDFELNEATLRIRGANSAYVSNDSDDEHTSKLVLGSVQSLLKREKGVINVLLCHHPLEWLYDGNDARVDINARAAIQLYGHKHLFDVTKVDNSLVLSAGAMQPSRVESNWEPRYNIIELDTTPTGGDLTLEVKIWKRLWDGRKTKKFVASYSEDGDPFELHSIKCGKLHEYSIKLNETNSFEAVSENEGNLPEKTDIINVNMTDPIRKLSYMFLSLPYHSKLKIAVELELVEDSDIDLNEVQKTQAYLRRATERKILGMLWNKITEQTGDKTENPFKN